MNAPYRLHYAPDNASLIVRLALEELGQPYETVLVDRSRDAQNSPEYLALNPAGTIPTLQTPDGPVSQTGAILLWLADRHGRMAPGPDAPARPAFLNLLFFVSNTLHADMRLLFYPGKYAGCDPDPKRALKFAATHRIARHLAVLEAAAAKQPDWFGGQTPSVLDCYVVCLLRWLALYPRERERDWFVLADLPCLHRLAAGFEMRPSVHAAQCAEGLDATPFTSPSLAIPPEGSAT